MQSLSHGADAMDDHDEHPQRPTTKRALASDLPGPGATSDDDAAERGRLVGRVHDAIGDLPEGYRRPLLLHVVGGLSYEELAADLRCTVNNARVKVHRGLKRLREMLGVEAAALPDQHLMGLFVPMLTFTPAPPPVPTAASAAAKSAATKKVVTKKILLKSTSAAGKSPIAAKLVLTAASLLIAAVAVVKIAPFHDQRANAVAAAPSPVAAPIAAMAAPLDGLPAASVAYGLRRLRSAYQGPALRVRTGDRQRDIGFTGTGELDVATLHAWCGESDGFVVRWYDQSGNGIDLAQRDSVRQPRVVVHGEVALINGRPALHIGGAEEWLDANDVTTIGSATVLLRAAQAGPFPEWKVVLGSNSTYDRRYFRGEIDHTTFDAVGETPSVFYVNGAHTNDNAPSDQGKVVTADLPQAIAQESLRLGNDRVQTHLRGWDGDIAEVIVFPKPLARHDRQTLTRAGQLWLAGEVTASVR